MSTVVFDLGNVVLGFDHLIICRKLSELYGITVDEVFECIFKRGLEKAFDEGRLSPQEFTAECSKALGVKLSAPAFKEIWSDMFWENQDVLDIVRELRPSARLLLLSNTNVWHVEYVTKHFSVLDLFDALILSFQLGHTKPHPAMFERTIELSSEPAHPSQTVFIDDKQEYTRAASELGLRGIHFTGAQHLRRELEDLSLL